METNRTGRRVRVPPAAVAALALLAALAAAACGRGPDRTSAPAPGGADRGAPARPVARPSVLLVTIDTWRWDHLGASGSGRVRTPQLDRLAAEGTYVPRVLTTCPLTTPAHASLLTGLLPRAHGIRDNQHFALSRGAVTLAERFRAAGYRTAAVVSGAPLRRVYGLDRGFDAYDDAGLGSAGDASVTPASRPAADATARALKWLDAQPAGAPLFLWVHYYDPHSPYAPPPPFREAYAAAPYAGEVAYVDAQLAPLLERVRAAVARSWVVAVTGDHGEALGDHGEATHGILLYAATTEVPLILWPRTAAPPGPGPFGLVDVAPTLAALAGLAPFDADGVSLFAPPAGGRWLAAETAYPTLGYGLAPGYLLRRGPLAYLEQGAPPEVYDLARDPLQARDLAATGEGADFARAALARRDATFGPVDELFAGSLVLPQEDRDALRGLGYAAAPPSSRAAARVDLRRFARDLAALQRARREREAGRLAAALGGYDAFLRAYPASALAHQERGQVLAALGRRDAAAAAFARALDLDPRDAVSALDLGNLAAEAGDAARAEALFRRSLAIEEVQPEAHLNLGLLYAYTLNRPADAKRHLARFLELAPADPEAPKVRELLASL